MKRAAYASQFDLIVDKPLDDGLSTLTGLLGRISWVAWQLLLLRALSAAGLLTALWLCPVQLFANVGAYLALLSIASICVFGRYEFLILTAADRGARKDAVHLAVCAAACAITIAFTAGCLLWSESTKLALILFPASLFARAWLRLGLTFATQNGYNRVIKFLIPHAVAQPFTLVFLLQRETDPFIAFAASDLVGQLVAAAGVAWCERRAFADTLQLMEPRRIARLALANSRLPTLNMAAASSAFLFAIAPILLLPTFANPTLSGTLALLFRILDMPTAMTSSSIGPIIMKEVADHRKHGGNGLRGRTFILPAIIALVVFGSISIGGLTLNVTRLVPAWHFALTVLPVVAFFQASIAATAPLIDIATVAGRQGALLSANLVAMTIAGLILTVWHDDPVLAIALLGLIGAGRASIMSIWLAYFLPIVEPVQNARPTHY
ncbi:hypothetical protein ASD45_14440 [Pseudolabrys sp. Root1462]|nr:hypothetical protein ASD45_14440 [Pseudolabrys sp. Root1462]